ncbi:MAG: TolC family protein [Candidatus Xenobiia bacterium LiM19]
MLPSRLPVFIVVCIFALHLFVGAVYVFGQEKYIPQIREVPVPPPVKLPAPPEVLSEATQKPLTALEAVRIALAHQASITVARAGIDKAQGNTMQVRAAGQPTLSVGTTYTGVTASSGGGSSSSSGTSSGGSLSSLQNVPVTPSSSSTGGSTPGYQMNATVRQLIFDFNRTRSSVRQALAEEKASTANLTRVQSDTVFNVKNAFFTYVQKYRLVNVNEQNVSTQQKHLELAQERWKAGVGLPSDVMRAETAVQNAIFNLTQARSDEQTARINLAIQMGIDPRTPIEVSVDSEPLPTSEPVERLFDIAIVQRPEMHQALAAVVADLCGVDAAYSNDAPTLTGQTGWFSRGSVLPPDTSYFNVGLILQWYLYDGGSTAGMVKKAKGALDESRAQLELIKQGVLQEVAASVVNLQTAAQRISTAEAEVANAEETSRLIDGRYKAGLGTFLDVLDAQDALVTARTNLVNAQSALDLARAALAHAIGNPLPGN